MEHPAIRARVCDTIAGMREEIVSALQELVRIPSVVGEEGKAQGFVEERYRSLGLAVTPLLADPAAVRAHPSFIETGMAYADRPNIIGRLAGDPESPSLILNGHIDVVSPEPVASWRHDPWG